MLTYSTTFSVLSANKLHRVNDVVHFAKCDPLLLLACQQIYTPKAVKLGVFFVYLKQSLALLISKLLAKLHIRHVVQLQMKMPSN
jgi:hypothetical protein